MTMLTMASKASGSFVEELSRRWTGFRAAMDRLIDSRVSYRRALAELNACSDRDLDDIGIAVGDIIDGTLVDGFAFSYGTDLSTPTTIDWAAQMAAHRDG